MSTEPNPIPATADQKLDVLRGLIENGYGPAHITAAALVAIDPHVHGRSLISIDEWDCDGDEPSNLHAAALDLIEASYLTEGPDGLGVQPYSDAGHSDADGAGAPSGNGVGDDHQLVGDRNRI